MSTHWWRAYDEAVDDPKLQQLPPVLFRAWFNICCLTSANDGTLPDIKVVAFKLRVSAAKAQTFIDDLRAASLIDDDEAGTHPHNWAERQFKSDVTDPTNAERQQRYRNRHGVTPRVTAKTVTKTVTPKRPETETETETETERIKDTADAVPSKYAFESGIIRLSKQHFNQWKENFTYLDVGAELIGLTAWAEQQGPERWFHAVASALNKRNREVKAAADKAKNEPAFKWNGIEGVI